MKLHEVKKVNIWSRDINGSVQVSNKNLASLKGAPKKVEGYFDCSYNNLTSLRYGPIEVNAGYYCSHNALTSLQGGPTSCREFMCNNNLLTNLKDIHKIIKELQYGDFNCSYNPIKSHMLGLCLIKGIRSIIFDHDQDVEAIFNKVFYVKDDPSERLLIVQDLLIDAGYPKLAQI